jgi:FHA domain
MTEHGILPGLWPIHGDGVLARQGDLVLLIHPAGGAFTDRLLDLLAEAAGARADGLGFTDLISAQFDADAAAADIAADQPGPAVVAFGPVGDGTAVAVYGTGWADVTTAHGPQRLTAGEPYGRLRCVLPSRLIAVRAGVQPVVGENETDPYLRLADGVVRAVALLYAPAEVRPEAAGRPRPAASGAGLAADVSPAVPAAAQAPAPAPAEPAAAQAPAPAPAEPEAVPEQVQPAAEPYADQIAVPEPGYFATQIEQAVAPAPAPDRYAAVPPPASPPPQPPAPHVAQAPPPAPDPYAAQAPAPDPYVAQAPPLAPSPYAAPAPPDPYAGQAPQPVPGPLAGLPDGGAPLGFISMSLVADQAGLEMPQRDPLPLGAEPPDAKDLGLIEMPAASVEGIYCKNTHFNDPEARYCAVCGISMGQLTKVRQKGTRPPLGVLILGDGSVCQLDADYVIGREPTLDSSVAEGHARPLRLMGASGVVSRIHARVELDGWQVFLTDLNSANGTQVLQPGERNPISLQPGVRTPLMAGAQIRLGGEYGLQYDSHRHR